MASLTRRAVRRLVLRFADEVPPEAFADLPGVEHLEVRGPVVEATVTGTPDALVKAAAGHELVDLSARDTELEEIFLAYYREEC